MEEPKVFQKSPIIKDEKVGTYYWCSCGRSNNQPYCNGSHKGTTFSPIKVDITEDRKVAWCACKNTKNSPFCDGTHKIL
ncbi:MAG: CDGSH iron-sulfur domain-containing protein [Ignavibacteria bacterium]